jgi:hypothetical protein
MSIKRSDVLVFSNYCYKSFAMAGTIGEKGWKPRDKIPGPLTEQTTTDASVSQMDGIADLQNGASTAKKTQTVTQARTEVQTGQNATHR